MSDAPKEIWFPMHSVKPYGEGDVKYIRADMVEAVRVRYQAAVDAGLFRIEQLEAERDAAYKRGLEDAAKIAAEWEEAAEKGYTDGDAHAVAGWIFRAIRAKMEDF